MTVYDKTEIAKADTDTLYQWMANAFTTTTCIGHTKGAMNLEAAETYRAELAKRGVDVGGKDALHLFRGDDKLRGKLFDVGVFNGDGAW
tara:strand:+ start:336 stop:602 length:267 start_codon:yes stop_codon:yes gene_type:complete